MSNISISNRSSILLFVSFLFFLRKGIQYAVIGSYVPLFLVLLILGGMFFTHKTSRQKAMNLTIKIWSFLLIIWGIMRFLFAIIHLTIQPFNEYHLNEQFSIAGILLSILFIFIGTLILKSLK